MSSNSLARVLLAQPQFAKRCSFSDTLIGLSSVYLATSEGINVPAAYDVDALEQTLAALKLTQVVRRWVQRRRGLECDALCEDVYEDVERLREELKEEQDRSAETRTQLEQLREHGLANDMPLCGPAEAGTELVLIQPLDQRDLEVLCAAPTPASNAPGLATTGPIAHLFCGSSGDTNRPTEANERWEVDVVREDEQQ